MLNSEIIEKIWRDVYKNQTPQDNPQGFVLGGQPGAGKSSLIKRIKNQLQDNVIVINGDDYRRYYPQYAKLQEKYGKDCVNHTADFAGQMTESILQKAINGRFNIVIEGTFRTTKTPIKTLKLFKDNAYKAHIPIQTCNKSISFASCNERYEEMREIMPNEARYTPKDKHDIVCENLAKNINEVYLSGFADSLRIYIRNDSAELNIKKFFDSSLDSKLDIEKLEKIISKSKFVFKKIDINISKIKIRQKILSAIRYKIHQNKLKQKLKNKKTTKVYQDDKLILKYI